MKMKISSNCAVILASGLGSRIGSPLPKQFIKIRRESILERSIEAFEQHADIHGIVLVMHFSYLRMARNMLQRKKFKKIINIVPGGTVRQESSFNGLVNVPDHFENVLIHDSARPFIEESIISECLKMLQKHPAVGVGVKVKDTLYKVSDNHVVDIPGREGFFHAQTPQCFRLDLIRQAHELALKANDLDNPDDVSLVVKYKLGDVQLVKGSYNNFKITSPEDIPYARLVYDKFIKA